MISMIRTYITTYVSVLVDTCMYNTSFFILNLLYDSPFSHGSIVRESNTAPSRASPKRTLRYEGFFLRAVPCA